MLYFIYAAILLYALCIGAITLGWIRLSGQECPKPTHMPQVTILVAYRNEEHTLPLLLADLAKQSYPKHQLQIIIVNDHSTDNCRQNIIPWEKKLNNLTCLELPEDLYGKKAALAYAHPLIAGELLVTTDADCRVPPQWISSLVGYQQKYHAEMVCGPVVIEPAQSLGAQFEALEFMSLNASGAGAIGIKRPIMNNAANMLYKKETYDKLKAEANLSQPSGDDIFNLLAQKKQQSPSIHFALARESLVKTPAQPSLAAFIAQRRRWTSKSPSYKDMDIIIVALAVAILNALLVITPIIAIFKSWWLLTACVLFVAKLFIDFPLLWMAGKFYQLRKNLFWFPVFQLVYPIYITFTIASSFFGKIHWKNRDYKIQHG